MNPNGRRFGWGWGTAGAGLVLALAVAVFLLRPEREMPLATERPNPARPAPVKLVNLKKNEAVLTDPTPLFLPTEWNAGESPLPANTLQAPGSSFADYPAKLQFGESELKLTFPAAVEVPARPADALGAGKPPAVYLGRDSSGDKQIQLTARKAFVEVMVAVNGQRVFAQSLVDAAPPGGVDWQPLELLVAVDPMGLVGPPIVTESSRVTAVDDYFQNYVVKTLRAGQRLAPGFYRISVGP